MLSPVLTSVLASRRSLFNQRVAQARQRWPALDTTALSAFIGQSLDPLCVAVAGVDEAAVPMVVEVAFELGLELVAQGLAGPAARLPWVDTAWQQLAVPAAPLLAVAPLETLGAISNAVVRMDEVPGVRVAEWLQRMAALLPDCADTAALRAVGALCAWQAGMAHLRVAALAQADRLPAGLAAAALGVEQGEWTATRSQIHSERWWHPQGAAANVQGQRLGGFTGLGGPFATPPQLRASAEGFIARSGGRHFLLIADAFGGVVLPASAAEFAAARETPATQVSFDSQGARIGSTVIAYAAPADGLAAVAGPAGVAVYSPWSHQVCLLPGTA
ncbi:hypothetical protein [Stenotrophomonas sp.]|uniref:hypothetical protein n=1 Tax=Stenotrophomonas sp. TaxID=69392 RepID=UPI0028A7C9E6|nr:hypothetical protein [Stenotrophomonas sp.]